MALAEKVDQLASRLDRSRGWIIRQALIAWIEQEEARNRVLPDGPGTVDARPNT
jgi:predicted transcriptional regulator